MCQDFVNALQEKVSSRKLAKFTGRVVRDDGCTNLSMKIHIMQLQILR